jgi:hypothetical protein
MKTWAAPLVRKSFSRSGLRVVAATKAPRPVLPALVRDEGREHYTESAACRLFHRKQAGDLNQMTDAELTAMSTYYQCLLRRSESETIGWIEERASKVGASVELKTPDGERWNVARLRRSQAAREAAERSQCAAVDCRQVVTRTETDALRPAELSIPATVSRGVSGCSPVW